MEQNRLKELRVANGTLMRELAALTEKDQSMLSRYENGRARIPLDVAQKLCQHYGVTAEYLLGWDRKSNEEGVAA